MSFDYFVNFFKGGNLFDLSHFYAQFLGLWLIVLSLYTFFKHDHLKASLEEVEQSPALQLSWALGTLFLGLFIILSHQIWAWDWAVLVTLIGWIITVMGLLRLFFPETFFKESIKIFEGPISYVGASIWLAIGIILSWWGFHHP